jgi:hypothetical protein
MRCCLCGTKLNPDLLREEVKDFEVVVCKNCKLMVDADDLTKQ